MSDSTIGRRRFLGASSAALCGIIAAQPILSQTLSSKGKDPEDEMPVTPPEDLMREHGVLKRVLLVYGEIEDRIKAGKDFPPEVLAASVAIIKDFIEDYHEKMEEEFLFPRFRKAKKLVELVDVLELQHKRGRALTEIIRSGASASSLKDEASSRRTLEAVGGFIRMYNPHEAREDTVLFPAIRSIVTPHEFAALGEDFEKKEHDMFGEDGFERYVDKIAGLEKKLGIEDLSFFTPR